MIKKTIRFVDFDGKEVVQDYYFHVARHELIDQQFAAPKADFEAWIRGLMAAGDNATIIRIFKEFVTMSYGRRNDEGGFEKDPAWTRAFMGSGAFDELVMEFFTDTSKASEFINGIMPAKLMAEAREKGLLPAEDKVVDLGNRATFNAAAKADETQIQLHDDQPDWVREGRVPTKGELTKATPEQIAYAMGMKVRKEDT